MLTLNASICPSICPHPPICQQTFPTRLKSVLPPFLTIPSTGGFHGNSPFCLGEDEEVEIEVQEDFLSFSADLVAEQLTYMDAVRGPEY